MTVRLNDSEVPVASFPLGTLPGFPNGYVLVVPMDALDPPTPNTARPGDMAHVYLDGALLGSVPVGDRGSSHKLDPVVTVPHAIVLIRGPTGTPSSTPSGGAIYLDVEAADTEAHPLTYSWSVACPGPEEGTFDNAQARTPVWTAPRSGSTPLSCTLAVAISDGLGLSLEPSAVLTVQPTVAPDPVPQFVANPDPTVCGAPMGFDAGASFHSNPERAIALYEWDFDYDGVTFHVEATGVTTTHGFGARATPVTVGLRVVDNGEPPRSAIATHQVQPGGVNRLPLANAGGPYAINSGSSVMLDGSGSGDPDAACGDAISSWGWDLDGDGSYDDAAGMKPAIAWATAQAVLCKGLCVQGSVYPIGLRVTDKNGASATAASTVSVLPPAAVDPVPKFVAGPDPSLCGEQVAFDAGGSYHSSPERSIVSYEWDFDYDGVTFHVEASGMTTTHGFGARATPVTVGLRVVDNSVPPRSAIATHAVHPGGMNRPPAANPGGPYGIVAEGSLALDGSASSDPDAPCGDAITAWGWDLNGDGSYADAAGPQPVIGWPMAEALLCGGICVQGRAYPIRLRVTDTRGETADAESQVAVSLLIFADDFANGTSKGDPDWLVRSGAWTVLGRLPIHYYASSPTKGGLTVAKTAALGAFATGGLDTQVKLTKSFVSYANGAVVFGYTDNSHYRYVRLQYYRSVWKLILGQTGAFGAFKGGAKASRKLKGLRLGRWYRLWVDVYEDGLVNVFFSSSNVRPPTPTVSYRFPAAAPGKVGYQAGKARAYFDDFAAWDPGLLP